MKSFSTEAQQIAIDLARDAIKLAFDSLVVKLKELECLEANDEAVEKIQVTKLRLDTLWKVEKNLLDLIHGEYAALGELPDSFVPSDIPKIIDRRNMNFVRSMLQGL